MARTVLLLLFLLFPSLCSCLQGKKLLLGGDKQWKNVKPSSRDPLFMTALPKGTVPPSSPSKKGHTIDVDEKLIARHLEKLFIWDWESMKISPHFRSYYEKMQ
ncbi:hypothetical protein RJT34_03547 [Clitoria ternatea]|uniref:Uncharacterized protein n=1 Tax=Clitoria ternatea TaxID=43366 RepID=A0AAN9KJM2_CLITE